MAKITSEREDAREEDREKRVLTSLKVITLDREKHWQSKVRAAAEIKTRLQNKVGGN